jgi:Xaa-Pro aminopeptidase
MKSDLDTLMQDRNLDAILIFGDAEQNPPMYYFVGGGHVSSAFLIKKAGKEPVLFYNDMERDEAAKSGLKTVSYSEFPTSEFMEQANGDQQTAFALRFRHILSVSRAGRLLSMAKWSFRNCSASFHD